MPRLLTDTFASAPIQAIELGQETTVAIGVASSNYDLTDVRLVRVALSNDSWIQFGTSGVTVSASTGHYFPKGVEVLVVPHRPNQEMFMAVISADGTTGFGSLTSAV